MQLVDALDQIDLLEPGAGGIREESGHKCRPELRAHFAGAEPRNIRVPAKAPATQIKSGHIAWRARIAANDPRKVAVCID